MLDLSFLTQKAFMGIWWYMLAGVCLICSWAIIRKKLRRDGYAPMPSFLSYCALIFGLILLLFPSCISFWCGICQRQAIEAFSEREAYTFAGETDSLADDMVAYLEIPHMGVNLPVYREKTLRNQCLGLILMDISEEDHFYVTGLNGFPGSRLFTGLDRLRDGDHLILHLKNEVLYYEVILEQVSEADKCPANNPPGDRTMLTLITSVPYGVGSELLLVTGLRDQGAAAVSDTSSMFSMADLRIIYPFWAFLGLGMSMAIIMFMNRWE